MESKEINKNFNDNPKISIIIPVYNLENTIEKCINSIKNQDYDNWECIIINDGSLDNSLNIIENLIINDSRFRVITKENQGVGEARNDGIKIAKGDWICFVDGDDWVNKNYLSNFLKINSKDINTLSISGFIREDINGNSIGIKEFLPNKRFKLSFGSYEDYKTLLLNGYPVNKLFSKEIIRKNKLFFNKNISLGEDHEFVLKYLSYMNYIIFDSTITYHYIKYDNNNSLTSKKKCAEELIYSGEGYINGLSYLIDKLNNKTSKKALKIFNDIYGLNLFLKAFLRINSSNYRCILKQIREKKTVYRKIGFNKNIKNFVFLMILLIPDKILLHFSKVIKLIKN